MLEQLTSPMEGEVCNSFPKASRHCAQNDRTDTSMLNGLTAKTYIGDNTQSPETQPLPQGPDGSVGKRRVLPGTTFDVEKSSNDNRTHKLPDFELVELCLSGEIPLHALERVLGGAGRAVNIRRSVIEQTTTRKQASGILRLSDIPFQPFDYQRIQGTCCENVIGYLPIPLGVAGPLLIDGARHFLPIATTEGGLVASLNRGCKAINGGGGATTLLHSDGMTRAPCIEFPTLVQAGSAKAWIDSPMGQSSMTAAFRSTSRFIHLTSIKTGIAGRMIFPRFKASTGDAMGMNMISKAVENALQLMSEQEEFQGMRVVSLSGNYCMDKKPAAINWIDGRGKGVVAEAVLPAEVVRQVLKTDVDSMVSVNTNKNMIGSALAGSIGGFNTHAANVVAAIFIATGQDPAQVVASSNCITVFKK